MPMDVGRFAVTQDANDLYVFKAPSLRNITRTYPYFHDGSVWSLRDATQIMARVQLGREMPEEDLDKLMAFYQALEGPITEGSEERGVGYEDSGGRKYADGCVNMIRASSN